MKNKNSISMALCMSAIPLALSADVTSPPNIILIMCDDLGWGDVGFNGNRLIRTPHLDALAKEGVIFDRFYAAAPVSSPTRASVLTGRHPFRMGIFHANTGILRPEEVTMPEVLKQQGYATGHFGKWHLGTLTDQEKDANRGGKKHPELLNPPAWHGYDEAFITESKVPTFDPTRCPLKHNNRFWDYMEKGDSSKGYGTHYWDYEGKKVEDNVAYDNSRVIVDRAIPHIDASVMKGDPFLSVLWFHTPHLPCVAGPEHVAYYRDLSLEERNLYGCITAMDEQVGRLVAYLKATGVYDNTLIFFCSDNGPEVRTPGDSGGLRERKRSLYEGGIRVPAFVVWPHKIAKGNRLKTPCVTSDYLPTVAEILDLSLPYELDGESILPLLKGERSKRNQPIVFASDNQAAVVDNDYKLYQKNGVFELYNIAEDRGEKQNLAEEQPKRVKEMKRYLLKMIDRFRDSFEGKEYGTASYKRVKQPWKDVLGKQQ